MNTDIALKVWNATTELQKAVTEAEEQGLEIILDIKWPSEGLLIGVEIHKAKDRAA